MGGIGPEATAVFYGKLIEKLQATGQVKENADFPQIVINSIPASELVKNSNSERLSFYIKGLKELDAFGVDFIVMVCNTIHAFYPEMQRQIKTPILDLREEVRKEICKRLATKIAVLGTGVTLNKNLYKFRGVTNIQISGADQKVLNKAIVEFNRGREKVKQARICVAIAEKCYKKGARLIILGCTEIALMAEKSKLPTLNTIEVLANAVVKVYIATKTGKAATVAQYLNNEQGEVKT